MVSRMRIFVLLALGVALGAKSGLAAPADSPPIQVGSGDITSDCGTSAHEWHDLMALNHTVIEGLLGADNPNVGIFFAQENPSGPWGLYMVKPDGQACLLISGPMSRTLEGDGKDPADLDPAFKD